MAMTIYPTVPVQGQGTPPEPWPTDEQSIRVDEMFARQLDTEFASGVRDLLHHPEKGRAPNGEDIGGIASDAGGGPSHSRRLRLDIVRKHPTVEFPCLSKPRSRRSIDSTRQRQARRRFLWRGSSSGWRRDRFGMARPCRLLQPPLRRFQSLSLPRRVPMGFVPCRRLAELPDGKSKPACLLFCASDGRSFLKPRPSPGGTAAGAAGPGASERAGRSGSMRTASSSTPG